MPDLVTLPVGTQATGAIGLDTLRGASGNLWKNCPLLELIMPGGMGRSGILIGDDFTTATAALTNAALSQYKVVGTTGVAALVSTTDGGNIQLQPGASANQETYLTWGQTTGSIGQILSNTVNALWFECRVKINNIVDGGYFFGLAKPGDVASGFLVNSTTVLASTVNAVGFNVANGTPANVDIVYTKAAAPTTYKANAVTATTSAFIKLGFRFNALNWGGQRNAIQFFVNGVEILSTAGVNGVAANATNFPSSVQLTPVFCAKNVTGTANTCNIDWWRCALIIEDPTQGAA
jgi:hypothetical protein